MTLPSGRGENLFIKTKIVPKKSALYLLVEAALRAKASILESKLFYLAVIDNNICGDTTPYAISSIYQN